MLVSIQLLDDKNWQTLLRNADVKILSVTVSRVMRRDLPGSSVLPFLWIRIVMAFSQVGGMTFFFQISAIIAVK